MNSYTRKQQRSRHVEFVVWLAVFGVSLLAAGWVAGSAWGALQAGCQRVYPAPPTTPVYVLGQRAGDVYIHPRSYEYIKCVRGQQHSNRLLPV